MANKANAKNKKELAEIGWEIRRAYQFKDKSIVFDLDVYAAEDRPVTIYGCRIVAGPSDVNFISFPSAKGKDGKYYSHAYIRLTAEEQEEIIEAVTSML